MVYVLEIVKVKTHHKGPLHKEAKLLKTNQEKLLELNKKQLLKPPEELENKHNKQKKLLDKEPNNRQLLKTHKELENKHNKRQKPKLKDKDQNYFQLNKDKKKKPLEEQKQKLLD